ncbi:MAG: T9SS type A sorting domain-containing protein [Candidatus Eisenbacteria bacterium]|nr:T9SS type A sorting domain-containing protein [Candidatus Eisenbacteria bacterium]
MIRTQPPRFSPGEFSLFSCLNRLFPCLVLSLFLWPIAAMAQADGGDETVTGREDPARMPRWRQIGSGTDGTVHALTIFDGALIAGGSFSNAGGAASGRVGRWNGSLWSGFGNDLGGTVYALAGWGGALVAGGDSLLENSGKSVEYEPIARWTGSGWENPSPVPINGGVRALLAWGGGLAVGGAFDIGGDPARRNLALLSGGAWTALGAEGPDGPVYALASFGGELIAAGSFSSIGGVACANIARWDGAAWHSLGAGVDGAVRALAVKGGILYAGGDFATAGVAPARRVAKWTGAAWRPLGAGVGGTVYALSFYEDYLVAGGDISTAGVNPTHNVTYWNGRSWMVERSGMNDTIYALRPFLGLIAGGSFTRAGPGAANRIARYTTDPPDMPTGVTASNGLCGKVRVEWKDVSGETGYRIFRNGTPLGDVAADRTFYDDRTAPVGTHRYRVLAFNSFGESARSEEAKGSLRVGALPPSGAQATDDDCATIRVTWGASPNADTYRIERNGAVVKIVSSSVREFVDAPTPGTYTYKISAGNGCGFSSPATVVGTRLPVPAAPAPVIASDSSRTLIRLDWGASAEADSYRVYRDGAAVAAFSASTRFWMDTSPTGTHTYGVSAGNTCGWSDAAMATGTILPPAPNPPGGLTASDSSCTIVRLDWNMVMGVSSFRVYRGGEIIALLPSTTTYYVDSPGPGVHTYGVSAGGEAGWSSIAVVAGAIFPAPETPGGLSASDGLCSGVMLDWNAVAAADSYEVFRDGASVAVLPSTILTFEDAIGSGDWQYQVVAKNKCGRSEPATATGSVSAADPGPPLSISASDDRCSVVALSWTPPPGADSCRILRDGEPLATFPATRTSWEDSGAVGEHVYSIAARNRCGWSVEVDDVGRLLPSAPGAPVGFAASENRCGSVLLTWKAAERSERYILERDGSAIDTVDADALSYEDEPGPGARLYAIRAENGCGTSAAASDQGRALFAPGSPGVLVASDTSCSLVRLEWTASVEADSYRVYRDGAPLASLPAASRVWIDRASSGSYEYAVEAGNGCGWSKTTAAAGTILPGTPLPPSDFAVTVARCDSVILSWTDRSEDETGFRIVRDGATLATLDADATRFADRPAPGLYEYELFAVGPCGSSPGLVAEGERLEPPDAPTLLSPAEGHVYEGLVTITLEWGAVPGADAYRVQMARDAFFSAPVLDETVSGTATTFTLPSVPEPGAYVWRVSAEAACGDGDWSSTRQFTREPLGAYDLTNRSLGFDHDPLGGPVGSSPPDPDPDMVVLRNEGETSFVWTAAPGQAWIEIDREGGSLAPGAEDTLWIDVLPELLKTGEFLGFVRIETDVAAAPEDTVWVDLRVKTYRLGDCNGDGELDERDLAALADHVIDAIPLWSPIVRIGLPDVNFDDNVDDGDMSVLPGLIGAALLDDGQGTSSAGASDAAVLWAGLFSDTLRLSVEGTGSVRAGAVRLRRAAAGNESVALRPLGETYQTALVRDGRDLVFLFYTLEPSAPSLGDGVRLDLAELVWEGAGDDGSVEFLWGDLAASGSEQFPIERIEFYRPGGPGSRSFAFFPVRPNPFDSECVISYELPEQMRVDLRIYDISGRHVRTLVGGERKAGFHALSWDGRDDSGRRVGLGVYFIKLESPRGTRTHRSVIVR